MRLGERCFVTIMIFRCFPPSKSALNFQNFKIKLFLTFDLISVAHFEGHIFNQHTLIVTIL